MHLFVFEKIMQKIMQKEKIFRRLIKNKSFIFEKNKFLRFVFVNEHFNWIQLQWNVILWTNEIWITNDKHTRYVLKMFSNFSIDSTIKIWIFRRVDEKYEIDCIMKKKKYQSDWMFWANCNYKTHTLISFLIINKIVFSMIWAKISVCFEKKNKKSLHRNHIVNVFCHW